MSFLVGNNSNQKIKLPLRKLHISRLCFKSGKGFPIHSFQTTHHS